MQINDADVAELVDARDLKPCGAADGTSISCKTPGNGPTENAADPACLQNKQRCGWTYFVRDGEFIKIGSSMRPRERIGMLQTGSSRPLEILAVVPMEVADEFATHQRFAHLRARGEWFRAEPDLLEFISGLERSTTDPQPQPQRIVLNPVVAELKALGRELSSRWSKLPKRARPFASNIIAQVKWIETAEDVERMRPHIAFQTRKFAEAARQAA